MANLSPSAKQQFFDANGNPLSGGKLYSYAAGTTTPLATYTNASGTTPNTNPIILDSRGEANLWLGTNTYKFKLTTSTDVEIWTVDNITSYNYDVLQTLAASGGSNLVGFLQSGTGAVARTVQAKLRDFVSVKDFGATGDGVTDDSAAIQAALNASKCVFFPAGTYYLATALTVTTGHELYGVNGKNSNFASGGTVLKPATTAIKSENFTAQLEYFRMSGIGFLNGTKVVDLGLFHSVFIEDCHWRDFSGIGLILVRGEKIVIRNCRWSHVSVSCEKAVSLATWEDSTYNYTGFFPTGYNPPGDGPWVDRITVDSCFVAHNAGVATCQWAFYCKGQMGNGTISNLLLGGPSVGGMYIGTVSLCSISNVIFDGLGSAGSPVAKAISLGEQGGLYYSHFSNISPSFANNCYFTKGFSIDGAAVNVIFDSCYAVGNNSTTYGFYFNNYQIQLATLVNCKGAYYHDNSNILIRNHVNQIGCQWTNSNASGGTNLYQSQNTGFSFTVVNDQDASLNATAPFQVIRARGSGNNYIAMYQTDTVLQFQQNTTYANLQLGNLSVNAKIFVGAGTPEANVTAGVGSIYLRTDGGAGTSFYVKQTGTGNTGWVGK